MALWRICSPNLKDIAPSQKTISMLPSARLCPCHWAWPCWQGWMSNSLSGKSQRLWHPYQISETPDKLINIYFIIWFLMRILSNETPSESNTQMVQETKTWHKQAWEWGSGKLIAGTCIYKLHQVCSLHFHVVSLLQNRELPRQGREWAMHLLFYPGRNQNPRLERNFSDASLDAEVLVGKEGRKLRASQGRNLERYLWNNTFQAAWLEHDVI